MRNIESLRSLQKRIREAKGADRELDRDIANAFRPAGFRGFYTFTSAPLYTADPNGLGPCVALMGETLPECRWSKTASGRYRVLCDGGFLSDADPLANDCLTFLDAIFSAAIAQEEAKVEAERILNHSHPGLEREE